MSIKYNAFGEVISVNGLTTGQHLGTPMQDALGTEQENSAYGEELATVTRCDNAICDKQPTPPSNNLDIEISENGTYNAPDGYTGFGTVTVNIASAEKKWLIKDVSCTTVVLNATGAVPEVGKWYVLCNKVSGVYQPVDVASRATQTSNLNYYAIASSTPYLTYKPSEGWTCTNGLHQAIPTIVGIYEWE